MNFSADLYLDYKGVFFCFFLMLCEKEIPKSCICLTFFFFASFVQLDTRFICFIPALELKYQKHGRSHLFPKWVTAYPRQHKYDAAVFRE